MAISLPASLLDYAGVIRVGGFSCGSPDRHAARCAQDAFMEGKS
jgi:hypothetical protein